MLKLGEGQGPRRIVLRPAAPATAAVKKGGKAARPASEGEPEAAIVMAPITPAMRRRAQRAMMPMLGDAESAADLDIDTLADIGETVSRELIRMGALEWEGIGDAGGRPVDLTPDRDTRLRTATDPQRPTGTIDLLLQDDDAFQILDAEYVRPDALRRAEKNGLSALPTGTGEAATPGKAIASSPAAARTRRAAPRKAGATNAHTRSTRSRRKPPKASGPS